MLMMQKHAMKLVSLAELRVLEPETLSDENGSVTKASIFTYGETLHSFISHDDYNGPFLPGFIEKKIEGEKCWIKIH